MCRNAQQLHIEQCSIHLSYTQIKLKNGSLINWCLDSSFSKQELHILYPRKVFISATAVAHISMSGLSRGVFASLRAPR